jgi:hypothetical protein
VFDSNLFTSVDKPPKLTISTSASVADIQAKMKDSSFYTALKSDPTALQNTQTALATQYSATALTDATTTEKKAAVVDAATTAIVVTAKATEVGPLVTSVANNLPAIKDAVSGGTTDVKAVMNAFLGDKQSDTAYVTATLTQLVAMNDAFKAMQTASTTGTSVDSTAFFASASDPNSPVDKVGLAQLAILAAAAAAITADNTDPATAAAALVSGTGFNSGSNITLLQDAQSGKNTATTNPYAYFATATSQIPGL